MEPLVVKGHEADWDLELHGPGAASFSVKWNGKYIGGFGTYREDDGSILHTADYKDQSIETTEPDFGDGLDGYHWVCKQLEADDSEPHPTKPDQDS